MVFPGVSEVKVSACNAGDLGSIPGERNGNPLQYSCLESPHGWRSFAGYSPRGHKESDTTELSLSEELWIGEKRKFSVGNPGDIEGLKKQKKIINEDVRIVPVYLWYKKTVLWKESRLYKCINSSHIHQYHNKAGGFSFDKWSILHTTLP